jgi:osmotically-inducible protein OsmY
MVGGTHGGMGAAGSAGYNRKAGFAYLQAGHMILRGVIAIAMSCVWGMQAGAQQTDVPRKLLEPIIVTAKKQDVPKTDEEVTRQVEAALRADPYVFDSHVRITTKDGVVTLSGFVLDVWDVYSLKRIVRKMAGVKKVVDQLTLELGGD